MNYKALHRDEPQNMLYTGQIKQVFNRLEKQDFFDSKVVFESYYYLYTLFHLFLQNLNIYKTEFHEYNFALFFFSVIFLSKRLWFTVWTNYKMKHSVARPRRKNLLICVFVVLSLNFVYCGVKLFYHYSLGSTFCLFYPYWFLTQPFISAILHFCVFGWFNTHRYSSPINELVHLIKSMYEFAWHNNRRGVPQL
eukprot:TRINITY_DN120300_c1_g1_i1.p1 TRINITY_DN120300_c1_g1~~TRINITY_DN120300_c1_g1_i1.p1  ORF type:complete len:221 (-),score=0.25 TRINITY_DN120300_c1_g1_i1:649-1230(-)